jgi:excisionase family DNA binding protein
MSELLTTKQVQDLLQVDRTTVYRMLNDGRLSGMKIGHQWRFPRQEVDRLLSGDIWAEQPPRSTVGGQPQGARHVLPLHCVQPVQDVFAELAQVGSVTTAPDGQPLTRLSNSCRFCSLIQSTETGMQACIASWHRLAQQPERRPRFAACHAGLQYARARIRIEGELAAMLVAGQFYADAPDPAQERTRVEDLARAHGLAQADLLQAAQDIPVLDDRKREQIGLWLEKVASTFENISVERSELMGRLQQIAIMSTLPSE